MSEFDLIQTASARLENNVKVEHSTLVGRSGQAVLLVTLNPQERHPWPSDSEIPGLTVLSETVEATPFVVSGEGITTLSWNDRELFESCHAPTLVPVNLERLPGLKAREGDLLPVEFSEALQWDWNLRPDHRLYGLGQRSMPLERRGTAPCNWTTDEPTGHNRSTDPLYQAHPLLWGATGDTWWAVFFLHSPYSRFDLGQQRHDRMQWLSLGASLQFQVHAAASPADLHRSLSQVLEPPSPPPLWALGFHQSRWGYRSAHEVEELVEEFRGKDIPLDVIHLDIDHMEDYRSFTFSKERFPEAPELFSRFAQKGVRVVTIIDPGLKFDPGSAYTPLDEGLAGQHFLKSSSGAPVVGYCWPDEALFPDFSRQSAREWWAEQADFYLSNGVAGLWIDMNEPAIFDKPFWTGGVKQQPMPLSTPGGEDDKPYQQAAQHNLYGSYMAQATHLTWQNRQTRPWVLTRSGFTGVGRYAWSWMGDNTSWWEHLAMSLPQLSSMGLVGCPFVGVDVGGFFGHCTGELYSAWIEASVIYPFMRAHSALGTRIAHPWSFGPEVEDVARTAIRFRYRLLPYLYTAAMGQSHGALPILRPMFFDYPQDERFAHCEDQVMFGPHLMAAPFLRRGEKQRLVLLPKGMWYDLHTGRQFQGGSSMVVDRRPGLVPLFAKAGSVIPLLAEKHEILCTDKLQNEAWQLHLCPGDDALESPLYFDEGEGWGFREGRYIKLVLSLEGESLQVVRREGTLKEGLPEMSILLASEQGWCESGGPSKLPWA